MKKILVATDFSNCARNAMEYALDLGLIMQAEICVIHAIKSTEGINNNTYSALYIEDYYNAKREALKEWCATFTAAAPFESMAISSVCEVGSVSNVIAKYIDENAIDLLVMGTMGSTGISGIFGSNASTMLTKTKISTLIIPLGSKFSMQPVITLATDFESNLSQNEVYGLNEIIKSSNAQKLNVLNIIEGSTTWKTNEDGEENLKTLITSAPLEFTYINESSPIDGIVNFVESNETDVLCLVKRHHNLLYRIFTRSTVNQVMNRSLKAVLVLHEGA